MDESFSAPELLLTDEIAEALLGALLTVCRCDGDTTPEELAILQLVGRELVGSPAPIIERQLFFSTVTPRGLADTIARAHQGGPFRGRAVSPPGTIVRSFVRAALRVARADGDLTDLEVLAINRFGRALGATTEELVRLDPWLDEARLL